MQPWRRIRQFYHSSNRADGSREILLGNVRLEHLGKYRRSYNKRKTTAEKRRRNDSNEDEDDEDDDNDDDGYDNDNNDDTTD